MPAAAPDNAPRPRLGPWLITGAVIPAVVVLLAGAAWVLAPRWFPNQVVKYSPWVGPAMRAAVGIESRRHGGGSGQPPLQMWVGESGERCEALIPYLRGDDLVARRIALVALAGLNGLDRPGAVDAALRELLHDPNRNNRMLAVMNLGNPESIPALEALVKDPDTGVAAEAAGRLQQLHIKAGH
ncbi:MAG: HEAT repeat domain-containing protein [Planctomycetes bacterium]|nr:HEAT repeat domain-containing protein [Planctomycetota bacterium]